MATKKRVFRLRRYDMFGKRKCNGELEALGRPGSQDAACAAFLREWDVRVDDVLMEKYLRAHGIYELDEMDREARLSYLVWIIGGYLHEEGEFCFDV